jgi:putative ubiquitin-RnfH superfamily antitoxin RatB of RatAB toxin-antitoxin module
MAANERPARVEVAYALAEQQRVVAVELPERGLTAREAVEASGLPEEFGLDPAALTLGVFGKVCAADRPLVAGDRVEIYRPLPNDPRAARRARVAAGKRRGNVRR